MLGQMILPQAWDITPIDFFSTYSYRITAITVIIIGACSGAMGCFLYLRKQSLLSDVVGHSAILGVMSAFVVAELFIGVDGRSMTVLTVGAVISAMLSVFLSESISRYTKLGQDAAMAICLALFYGLGITALYMITHSSIKNRGGISGYMFGSTSSLVRDDAYTIGAFALVVLIVMVLLWKELKLFIFDPIQAEGMGFKPSILVPILLIMATISIVIGVKAVGLILMVAFAIMPAASARQWCQNLSTMVVLAAVIGAVSSLLGVYLAVNMGKVPAGPLIVVVLFVWFMLSIMLPRQRSVVRRLINRRKIQTALRAQLLAACAEGAKEETASCKREEFSASKCCHSGHENLEKNIANTGKTSILTEGRI